MKVWLENPFDNLPAEGYRPQRYWLMAEAFIRAGHSVTLFTSDFSHAHKRRRVLDCDYPTPPFRLVQLPTAPYHCNVSLARIRSHRVYARDFLAAAKEEIAAGNAPDLLIVSMPPLSTTNAALAIKRIAGCKLVFDVQDAWPETFERLFPSGTKWAGKILLSPLKKIATSAYRQADAVTGVSERYREIVLAAGARSYQVFPLGIAMPRKIASEPAANRPAQSLAYIGNLGRGYDLGTVIDALAELPGATLDIAGAGEREEEWKARAKGNPRVRFHGYLSEKELSRLLDNCSIGVIPMRDDSFVGVPNKLADYAAHGLRVVSSLRGDTSNLLSKYNLGADYNLGDVKSLVEAVRQAEKCTPDFAAFLRQLDATRIYDEYAASPDSRVSAFLVEVEKTRGEGWR